MRVDSDRGWKYQVYIRTPAGMVFEGTVCFNLHRKIGCEDNATVSDTVIANLHQHRQCEENACVTDTAVAVVSGSGHDERVQDQDDVSQK